MRRDLATWLAVLSLLATACGAVSRPVVPSKQLKVVATFSVIGDFARNVGGDLIELATLAGPGQDTHTFEPNPGSAQSLAEAALAGTARRCPPRSRSAKTTPIAGASSKPLPPVRFISLRSKRSLRSAGLALGAAMSV